MRIIDLGLSDFREVYYLQQGLVKEVFQGKSENTLIITEHKPVITIGRKGSWNNIFKSGEFLALEGVDVLNIDRGGDVTYHGPGQIIAYPVFRLENESRDIHAFLRFLEDIGCHFLTQYGLIPEKISGLTGVWIKGAKIGSIGIGVKKWVTYHGLSLNINIDLDPFSFIRPCGIEGVRVTSLKNILGRDIDIKDAKDKLKISFEEIPFMVEAAAKPCP
jgi:lipoyl(octanoyl) transferase